MDKSPDAFRTISEVSDWLDTPAHVLRFWESRFPQVRPVKRAGGRRYYRPSDVALLSGIKKLLHDDGLTIRGVQKMLREQGIRHVASLGSAPGAQATEPEPQEAEETDNIFAHTPEAAPAAGKAEPETPARHPHLRPVEPEPEPKRPAEAAPAQVTPTRPSQSPQEPPAFAPRRPAASERDLFSPPTEGQPVPEPPQTADAPHASQAPANAERAELLDRLRSLDADAAEAAAPKLTEIYSRLQALRARMAAAPEKNDD